MSAETPTAGHPAHRVTEYERSTNVNDIVVTVWEAACGYSGRVVGMPAFKPAGQVRRNDLCPTCFPGRDASRHYPEPVYIEGAVK